MNQTEPLSTRFSKAIVYWLHDRKNVLTYVFRPLLINIFQKMWRDVFVKGFEKANFVKARIT